MLTDISLLPVPTPEYSPISCFILTFLWPIQESPVSLNCNLFFLPFCRFHFVLFNTLSLPLSHHPSLPSFNFLSCVFCRHFFFFNSFWPNLLSLNACLTHSLFPFILVFCLLKLVHFPTPTPFLGWTLFSASFASQWELSLLFLPLVPLCQFYILSVFYSCLYP